MSTRARDKIASSVKVKNSGSSLTQMVLDIKFNTENSMSYCTSPAKVFEMSSKESPIIPSTDHGRNANILSKGRNNTE